MLSQYTVLLSLVLGIAVLCGAFYIYRQERRLESISRSGLTMEKTESARPWSRQFLINENDLESGPQVEDEDNTDSFHYEPPMIVGDSSLPIVPPLVFEDARLALQPEGPGLALSPPRSSPVDLPAQPSAALLPNSHARRGSDTVALTCGTPGVRGVAYLHGSDGVETARSSMVLTSSILPPSYHSNYPVPVNPQSGPVRE